MARHKVTFEFASTATNRETAGSQAGWTESWYDPDDLTQDQATTKARNLRDTRRGVLTAGWSITAMRLGELDAGNNPTRRGILIFVPPDDQPGTFPPAGVAGTDNEQPYDALVWNIGSAGGRRRAFSQRGIPNSIVTPGARYVGGAGWQRQWPLWSQQLIGGPGTGPNTGYAIKYRLEKVFGTLTAVSIPVPANAAGADPQHPQLVVVVNEGEQPPTANSFISIRGALGNGRLNGVWKIRAVKNGLVPDTYVVQTFSKRRVTVTGDYVSGGVVEYWGYGLDRITTVTPGYGSSRRTGRPPQLVRGRRSNRAL